MHEAVRLNYRENLIAELKLVAAPAQTQIDYLREHRVSSDELALAFDDLFVLAHQAVGLGLISKAAYDALARLDAHFTAISGQQNAHLWTDEALQCAVVWRTARAMAQSCLDVINAKS